MPLTRSSSAGDNATHRPAASSHRFDRYVRLDNFSAEQGEDARTFLQDLERLTTAESWPDSAKLSFVPFLLKGPARIWFDNHCASFRNWAEFIVSFRQAYINDSAIRARATHELRSRAQLAGETCHEYVQAILRLCRDVDGNMKEEDKVRHIMKGISESVYYFLHFKELTTVEGILDSCRRFDNAWSERISTIPSNEFPRLSHVLPTPIYSSCNPSSAVFERASHNESPITPDLEKAIEAVVRKVINGPLSSCAVSPAREAPAFQPDLRQCHYCHKLGHVQRFCKLRAAEQQSRYRTGYNGLERDFSNSPSTPVRRNARPFASTRYQRPPFDYDARPQSPSYASDFPPNFDRSPRFSEPLRNRSPSPAIRTRSPNTRMGRSSSPHPRILNPSENAN